MVRYNFFRSGGSLDRWCWLAIIMRGRSQVVSIRRGVDKGSEEKRRE